MVACMALDCQRMSELRAIVVAAALSGKRTSTSLLRSVLRCATALVGHWSAKWVRVAEQPGAATGADFCSSSPPTRRDAMTVTTTKETMLNNNNNNNNGDEDDDVQLNVST